MIVVRVLRGIQSHFPNRVAEWFLSVALLNWGLILLGTSSDIFTVYNTYAGLARLATEFTWGILATSIGLLRLTALVINGTFYDTWYSAYSPHVRGMTSFFSCFFWTQIVLSHIVIIPLSPAIAIYATFLFMDVWCMNIAWKEAGKNDSKGG